MAFEVRSIFSLIISKNLKHIKWFSALLLERSNSKQQHHLLPKRYSYPAKLLICLLSLNVLLVSTYHVICIELSGDGISRSHLQIHDCHYPQDNGPGSFIHSDNHKTSHAVLLGSQSKAQSCPDCIDEHIQFIKSFPKINLYAASLLKTFLPTIQSNTPQFLFAAGNSSVPREHSFPLSFFRSSVIRSTILLI